MLGGEAMEGVEPSSIILSTLGFNASLIALLLAAQGYITGRLVPAGERLGHYRILWIVPGMLLALYGVYMVAYDFHELTKATSHQQAATFVADWINNFWHFYALLAVAIVATGVAGALARNPKE
jgi:hypothetical protein